MRVDLVDPPAYSLPYDDALASGLAARGAAVRLVTSAFAYAPPPPAHGYVRDEFFYTHAFGAPGSRLRGLSKRAEHPIDMLRYRAAARRAADVVHFQWLTVPRLDLRLLPRRPTVLTIHDPLERHRDPLPAPAFAGVDAIVVHSEYAREQVIAQHGLAPERVHVIRHGVLGAREGFGTPTVHNPSPAAVALPPELDDDGTPVVLSYGLIRPYKGIEKLLEAWRGIKGAQLWIVGRPMMDLAPLQSELPPGVQILPRFVTLEQERALFARTDLAVLPYQSSGRFGFSGVLATALGHGRAILLSDVGGFSEVGALGAARLTPAGDVGALHQALAELIADPGERARLASVAAEVARTTYSWEAAAAATLALYETIAAP
jgi:glycosyltransferase involved in cell wall biosynthesis